MVKTFSAGNGIQCEAVKDHKWVDTEEFLAANPPKIPVAQKVAARPPGHMEVKVFIPGAMRDILVNKFGDKLPATVEQLLRLLCEGKTVIFRGEDLERMEQLLGQKVGSAGELFGVMFAKVDDLRVAREELESLHQTRGAGKTEVAVTKPGDVVVNFDRVRLQKMMGLAKARSQTIETFIEETMQMAMDNNWA